MTTLTNPQIFGGWHPDYRRFRSDAPTSGEAVFVRNHEGARVEGVPRKYIWHSPDGFEWGYGGSGPADLALNILGMFVPAPEAWRLHIALKDDVIATLDRERPELRIPLAFFAGWIRGQWSMEDEHPEFPRG